MTNLFVVIAVIANISLGLLFEAHGARVGWAWAELAVGVLTTAHLAFYFYRPPLLSNGPVNRVTLLLCLTLATLGEIFLSAILGLYTYRQSFLPAFVPPGHVLLFLAGLIVADQKWCGRWIVWLVSVPAALVLLALALKGEDQLSLPLFFLFLTCLALGAEKRLYAVMFALALALEFLGTWLAAWQWHPQAAIFSASWRISAANPPLAAGAFYACLDLLTVRLQRGAKAWRTSLSSLFV